MPDVIAILPTESGRTDLSLFIRSAGVLVNAGGDAFTETPASSGRFVASVSEALSGTYDATVEDATQVVGFAKVDSTNLELGNLAPPPSVVGYRTEVTADGSLLLYTPDGVNAADAKWRWKDASGDYWQFGALRFDTPPLASPQDYTSGPTVSAGTQLDVVTIADVLEDGDYTLEIVSDNTAAAGEAILTSSVVTFAGDQATAIDNQPTNTNAQLEAATETILAAVNANSVGGPVGAERISPKRTWYAPRHGEGHQADNIVTIASGFDGSFAFNLTDTLVGEISAITSVTLEGPSGTVTTSNLRRQADDLKVAIFDTAAINTAGTYTARIVVTTLDSQTLAFAGTLVVE